MTADLLTAPWRAFHDGPDALVRSPVLEDDLEVLAIGDVHGRDAALEALIARLAAPPGPGRRIVVFVGDLIDRGPGSIRAIEAALGSGDRLGAERAILLPGNHELMALDAIEAPGEHGPLWIQNGGEAVLEEAEARVGRRLRTRSELPDLLTEALPAAWFAAMAQTPGAVEIGRVLLVHAGVDPDRPMGDVLAEPPGRHGHARHWAWIREPFLDHRSGWGGRLVVHGHTPLFDGRRRLGDAETLERAMDRVADRGRLNLDVGAGVADRLGFAQIRSDRRRVGAIEL